MLSHRQGRHRGRGGELDRRAFLRVLGGSACGLSLAALGACREGGEPLAVGHGDIAGTVLEAESGEPEPVGRIFLMYDTGLQTGRHADIGNDASFRFPNVAAGRYQLRFHAPRVARVPEPMPNPLRLEVVAGEVTEVTFRVERGVYDENMIEIYAGDDFFQEQPYGEPNKPATVEKGVIVCWYNVGRRVHDVTGQPWGTSGDLPPTGSFIWEADRVGEFPYQCTYHQPQMRSTLVVTE